MDAEIFCDLSGSGEGLDSLVFCFISGPEEVGFQEVIESISSSQGIGLDSRILSFIPGSQDCDPDMEPPAITRGLEAACRKAFRIGRGVQDDGSQAADNLSETQVDCF